MNWYKKSQEETSTTIQWTDDEEIFLMGAGEDLELKQRDSMLHNVSVSYDVSNNATASFLVNVKEGIDTQVGTKLDRYKNSLHIEKVANNFFYVRVNEGDSQEVTNFDQVKEIVNVFVGLP